MKLIIACITIIILGYYSLYAQSNADYFPYEKNNYWEYYWVEFGYPDTIVSFSVFDSVDSQGRKIAIFDSYFINPLALPAMLPDSGTFIIDSSLNVFTNWTGFGNEYDLVYKLNGNQGDQWVIYDYSQIGGQGFEIARIREIRDDVILGITTKVMQIDYYWTTDSTDTTGILQRGSDFLAKDLGLQGRFSAEFASIYLKGAVIDGVLYGDTTHIIVGLNEENQQYLPEKFELYQNYPNPFNPHTTIKFDLHKPENISLVIYNTLGKEVIKLINDSFYKAGTYEKSWSGTDSGGNKMTSGVYFYSIKFNNKLYTRSMILIK